MKLLGVSLVFPPDGGIQGFRVLGFQFRFERLTVEH
jgi:hypothetical protein